MSRRIPALTENDLKVMGAVKTFRGVLGVTQQDLSEKLGITVRTVARWETAVPPKGKALGMLLKLARFYKRRGSARIFAESLSAEIGIEIDPGVTK